MHVTVAIDSLKGSLTSIEAGEAVKQGIFRVYPDAIVQVCPLADGGEGTADALTTGMKGEWITIQVTGPVGKPVTCSYGIIKESQTAVMEMSSAAGITLVTENERNPMNTTTFGVGEMILDAIKRGCRKFIVGIGGSATNDGGIGMLQALGFGLLDQEGNQVSFGAKGLSKLVQITDRDVIDELKDCSFRIACDVSNPLCGEEGCNAVFGPQKGATKEMISQMDTWLSNYAQMTKKIYNKADREQKGAGAAGGLGFAFLTFTNAVLESGVKIVLEETNLEETIQITDLVITGEGKLDSQTVMGKAPIGVARLAKQYDKPVLAFSGCVTEDATICNEEGIDAFFPILRRSETLEESMEKENASKNMTDTVEQVFRLMKTITT